ncbi:MAG: oligosaccharide flippase family protein, partial [Clostridia bacterium]|nr:oligosaccharide flippase family protein [Clostridia bacterium]
MSKQNILRSAAGLTLSGIIAKTIDFLFRAYYSTLLGSEGMGLFSLVFSFHGLILTFATAGLGVAVSKTVSLYFATKNNNCIKKTMKIALLWVVAMSLGVILTVCIFSKNIAESFLKEPRVQLSIIFLSPSILFMSISYCIKGYFYAARKILIPASSEFLEQAVKIISITLLLNIWRPLGIQHGCEAVFLGITIGEFSSCFFL